MYMRHVTNKLAIFFSSLQALDFINQRKKVVCRLRLPPPGIPPLLPLMGATILVSVSISLMPT